MTKTLRELALAATPGPWWIDSHGHCMVSKGDKRKTIFITNSEAMGPAVRHADTGNLSHWRNDNDASYIAAASPDVVISLLDRIAELERDAARLNWIQRNLFGHKWNGVIDSGSQTNWRIWGGYRHITANMIGNTFGEAIDNAMKEQK